MRKALIIGIDNYKGNAKLNCCVNDANDIATLLGKNEDGSDNFVIELAIDIQNKTDLIAKAIELFRPASDIALFYFSGHGDYDDYDTHLVTPDKREYDPGISMMHILSIANRSPAKNKIIVLDCCYAAGVGYANPTSGMIVSLNHGITILASCRRQETAVGINGHSVFTNLLAEALKGGAADLNGNVTPGGIYAFIDKAMGEGQQRPVFKTNISEFVPVRTVVPPVSPLIMQQLPVLFPDATELFSLDPSFEDTNDPTVKHEYIEPYAKAENVKKFKQLQKLQSVGLVEPVDAPFMYFAAMNKKSCRLTPLGQHYWRLMKDKR